MTDNRDPLDLVRPLLRTRQIREFTDEPVGDADLHAITEVARWSGSSTNDQPWRFLVIRDRDVIRRLAEVGVPRRAPSRARPSRSPSSCRPTPGTR